MTVKSTEGKENNTNAQGVEHTWLKPGAIVPGVRIVPIEGDVVHGKQAYRMEIVSGVQTWSVVVDTEGHPEHDSGTTYSVVASGLSHDAAMEMVADIEHEADAALDECGCGDVSEIDGEVRHTCSGYPIVTAFVCLDDRIDRYVSAGRAA